MRPVVFEGLPTLADLDDLTDMVGASAEKDRLYVRWSAGPAVDLRQGQTSRDPLTGVPMPGLSANPLAVEQWWELAALRMFRCYPGSHAAASPADRPTSLPGRTHP
jgi:hypothetical protein